MSSEAVRLLQRQVCQEAPIRIDGKAVDVAFVDSFGVLAHHVLCRDDVGIVKASKQVLAETPRQNRIERRIGSARVGAIRSLTPCRSPRLSNASGDPSTG